MNDRKKQPEYIDRFNNGNLTGKALTAFLEEVKTNPRLREEVRLDSELNEILSNFDLLELREKLISVQKLRRKRKRPEVTLLLMAASLLLLIGFEVFLLVSNMHHRTSGNDLNAINTFIGNQKPVSPSAPVTAGLTAPDKIDKQGTNLKFAELYKKNPAFENMIGTTRNSVSFTIISPIIGERFRPHDDINFVWKSRTSIIELIILDNAGRSAHSSGTIHKNAYTVQKGTLKPGLYYFRVIQNDEPVFFGKFSIE
jgi:hypothetical protein